MLQPFNSREEWRALTQRAIATLASLSGDDFFDESSLNYHPVVGDILRLTYGLEKPTNIGDFLAMYSGRSSWLPDDPAALDGMDVTEIHHRISSNLADERWVDGALGEAFDDRTLIPALERLEAELARFELASPIDDVIR